MISVCIFGVSGSIGCAFAEYFLQTYSELNLFLVSRTPENIEHRFNALAKPGQELYYPLITHDVEESLDELSSFFQDNAIELDYCVNAIGILHSATFMPEKKLGHINQTQFQETLFTNTIIPSLIIRYLAPFMNKKSPSIMAHLSARVGSITDNKLGGWYAYRAAKSALNMVIKTASIEMARFNKQLAIIGVHPGTVDSHLSAPFKKNVAEQKLFSPQKSVGLMMDNIFKQVSFVDSGKVFAWDGVVIPA